MTRELWTRGDSGFAVPELMDHIEAGDEKERLAGTGKRLYYVIKLKHNAVLQALAEPHLKRGPGRPPRRPVRKYVELRYAAQSWKHERRVVLTVTFLPHQLFPETAFLVTNVPPDVASGEEVFDFYRRRGDDSENRIKEAKRDIKIDRTSCHSFDSNRVRLAFAVCAYLIAHWTRTLGRSPGGCHNPPANAPTLQALRMQLLKIGARLLVHARRAYLLLASACPTQDLFRTIHARLRVVAEAAAGSLVRVALSFPEVT